MPFWKLYYHLVWATSGRQPLIHPEIEHHIHESINYKVKALGGQVFGINGTEDHMHVAVTIPPTISVAKFVGEVKGASSYHINHLLGNQHALDWQRGYGAVSFRKDNLEQVLEYIRHQKEHHAEGKIWGSLEDCGEDDASKRTVVREDRAEYDW